jgi:ribosomal protein L37AE/L43A
MQKGKIMRNIISGLLICGCLIGLGAGSKKSSTKEHVSKKPVVKETDKKTVKKSIKNKMWECNRCGLQYTGSFPPSGKCQATQFKNNHWWTPR